jgi:polysaccharide biosynthesis transport protein
LAEQQAETPNFRTLTGLLRRRWRVMLPFLLVPIAALAFSRAQEERYSATASILIRDARGSSVLASEDPEREAATNVLLLSQGTIRARVEDRLGGDRATADSVDIAQEGQSNIFKVTATDPSPQVAARTANAYAAEYVSFRRREERREIRAELRFLGDELDTIPASRRHGEEARRLRSRIRQLEFEASRSAGPARMITPAAPPSTPSSPKPVQNTIIGAIVGLFLAAIAALVFERLDPRLKTPKEAEAALERPILGLIRRSRKLSRPARGTVPLSDFDHFVALRSYLRYGHRNGDIRSVLITSAATGDGKTMVAWNLASAAAAPGRKVLLVEADVRDPTLAAALGATPERGLNDVLAGNSSLEDVVEDVALETVENGSSPARIVSVAFAGAHARMAADPHEWDRLGVRIKHAEREYDLIVIDTAPIVSVPDAVPLLPYVGGVIAIGRLGSTPRSALARLKDQLDSVEAPTVGVVVNAVGNDAMYGYGYSYRYGRER